MMIEFNKLHENFLLHQAYMAAASVAAAAAAASSSSTLSINNNNKTLSNDLISDVSPANSDDCNVEVSQRCSSEAFDLACSSSLVSSSSILSSSSSQSSSSYSNCSPIFSQSSSPIDIESPQRVLINKERQTNLRLNPPFKHQRSSAHSPSDTHAPDNENKPKRTKLCSEANDSRNDSLSEAGDVNEANSSANFEEMMSDTNSYEIHPSKLSPSDGRGELDLSEPECVHVLEKQKIPTSTIIDEGSRFAQANKRSAAPKLVGAKKRKYTDSHLHSKAVVRQPLSSSPSFGARKEHSNKSNVTDSDTHATTSHEQQQKSMLNSSKMSYRKCSSSFLISDILGPASSSPTRTNEEEDLQQEVRSSILYAATAAAAAAANGAMYSVSGAAFEANRLQQQQYFTHQLHQAFPFLSSISSGDYYRMIQMGSAMNSLSDSTPSNQQQHYLNEYNMNTIAGLQLMGLGHHFGHSMPSATHFNPSTFNHHHQQQHSFEKNEKVQFVHSQSITASTCQSDRSPMPPEAPNLSSNPRQEGKDAHSAASKRTPTPSSALPASPQGGANGILSSLEQLTRNQFRDFSPVKSVPRVASSSTNSSHQSRKCEPKQNCGGDKKAANDQHESAASGGASFRVGQSVDECLPKATGEKRDKSNAAVKAEKEVNTSCDKTVAANGSGDKSDKNMWPAWVYCTRYSDRPSAGPRHRKKSKKTNLDTSNSSLTNSSAKPAKTPKPCASASSKQQQQQSLSSMTSTSNSSNNIATKYESNKTIGTNASYSSSSNSSLSVSASSSPPSLVVQTPATSVPTLFMGVLNPNGGRSPASAGGVHGGSKSDMLKRYLKSESGSSNDDEKGTDGDGTFCGGRPAAVVQQHSSINVTDDYESGGGAATGEYDDDDDDDDNDSNGSHSKRPRTAFTSSQLNRLKHEFEKCKYLTGEKRQYLAVELRLNESQIKIWFQNKRAKIKKSSGVKNTLALQLMAQGLYNHTSNKNNNNNNTNADEDDDDDDSDDGNSE